MNSFSESVRGLATTDGTVAIGTGSLSVSGPLSMTGGTITGTSPGVLRLLADVSATSSATGTATISAPVFLNGARTFTVADGPQAVDLSIANSIGDGVSASSLTKAGPGTMSITGTTGNTYTGDTTVQAGILATAHAVGVGIPANVTIGTGAGGPSSATLRLDQSSELSSTAHVTVQQDGLFNLNAFTQTVGALTVHGGAVTIGGGVLTAAGGGRDDRRHHRQHPDWQAPPGFGCHRDLVRAGIGDDLGACGAHRRPDVHRDARERRPSSRSAAWSASRAAPAPSPRPVAGRCCRPQTTPTPASRRWPAAASSSAASSRVRSPSAPVGRSPATAPSAPRP